MSFCCSPWHPSVRGPPSLHILASPGCPPSQILALLPPCLFSSHLLSSGPSSPHPDTAPASHTVLLLSLGSDVPMWLSCQSCSCFQLPKSLQVPPVCGPSLALSLANPSGTCTSQTQVKIRNVRLISVSEALKTSPNRSGLKAKGEEEPALLHVQTCSPERRPGGAHGHARLSGVA